jgi:hypothetical protein
VIETAVLTGAVTHPPEKLELERQKNTETAGKKHTGRHKGTGTSIAAGKGTTGLH